MSDNIQNNVDRNELQKCTLSLPLQLHNFVGTSTLCQQCHKTRTNAAHTDPLSKCGACKSWPVTYICATCMVKLCANCKTKHIQGSDPQNDYKPIAKSDSDITIIPTTPTTPIHPSKCIGHECSICSKEWFHDYNCGRKHDKRGLCKECTQTTNLEIKRESDLKDLKYYLSEDPLTGQEKAQAVIQGEEDIYKAIHDSSGKRVDNWQDITREYISKAERAISTLKSNIQGASRARRTQEEKDLKAVVDKLTSPEEIAEYKRRQIKDREAKKHKVSNNTPRAERAAIEDKNKAYQFLLQQIKKSILSKHPQLTNNPDELKRKIMKQAEIVDITISEGDIV